MGSRNRRVRSSKPPKRRAERPVEVVAVRHPGLVVRERKEG